MKNVIALIFHWEINSSNGLLESEEDIFLWNEETSSRAFFLLFTPLRMQIRIRRKSNLKNYRSGMKTRADLESGAILIVQSKFILLFRNARLFSWTFRMLKIRQWFTSPPDFFRLRWFKIFFSLRVSSANRCVSWRNWSLRTPRQPIVYIVFDTIKVTKLPELEQLISH